MNSTQENYKSHPGCTGAVDCQGCIEIEQQAADQRYQAMKMQLFNDVEKPKRPRRSVVHKAQPHALRNITHVAGTVPTSNPPQPSSGSPAVFTADPTKLSEATVAKLFMLAGNAYFTVRSQKTGTRYTYRVNRANCSRCGRKDCQCWAHPAYFVALLTGPDNTGDYTYLGMLKEDFRLTKASRMAEGSLPVVAFRYVWQHLQAGRYPPHCEIWHEGRCGRCGRMLTVPESVARGIGPECAGMM